MIEWKLDMLFLLQLLEATVKQVRSDNDASEVGILGHFGTFWDNLVHFGTTWDIVGHFGTIQKTF